MEFDFIQTDYEIPSVGRQLSENIIAASTDLLRTDIPNIYRYLANILSRIPANGNTICFTQAAVDPLAALAARCYKITTDTGFTAQTCENYQRLGEYALLLCNLSNVPRLMTQPDLIKRFVMWLDSDDVIDTIWYLDDKAQQAKSQSPDKILAIEGDEETHQRLLALCGPDQLQMVFEKPPIKAFTFRTEHSSYQFSSQHIAINLDCRRTHAHMCGTKAISNLAHEFCHHSQSPYDRYGITSYLKLPHKSEFDLAYYASTIEREAYFFTYLTYLLRGQILTDFNSSYRWNNGTIAVRPQLSWAQLGDIVQTDDCNADFQSLDVLRKNLHDLAADPDTRSGSSKSLSILTYPL